MSLPEALPVMPLRDAVAFPETLMPLAVEQERSIELVNQVLTGDRMLVITGALPPDSLLAMIRRMNAEMRSK